MECGHKYLPLNTVPVFWRACQWMLLLLLLLPSLKAQQRYKVVVLNTAGNRESIADFKNHENYDSSYVVNTANSFVRKARSEGYLYANLDSLFISNDTFFVSVFKGNRWFRIWDESQTQNAFLRDEDLVKTFPVDTTGFRLLGKKWLDPYLNHGYPFAAVEFNTKSNNQDSLIFVPKVKGGRFFVYDTLTLRGNLKVSKKFLQQYLDIIPGQAYNHSRIEELGKMINDLPFAVTDSLPSIYFYSEKATIQLYAGSRQASRFDFILGLAPAASGSGFTFNGELTTDLVNRFGRGESLNLRFKRLSLEDQLIQVNFTYPYLLGTRFGFDGSFGINRNRSLSIDAYGSAGFQFMVSGKKSLKLLWTTKSSSLTEIDTLSILNTGKLPEVLDYQLNGLAFSYLYRNLDYRFNPKKGFEVELGANAGFRKIVPNVSITQLVSDRTDFSAAYDSLADLQLQTALIANASFYRPLKNWATIKCQVYAGSLIQKGKEVENEAYRLGGLKNMRGFQELSILARSFAILTLEGRVILDRNSYLSFPFIDLAKIRVSDKGTNEWKTAIGVGLGLNFSTKAGIFNFSIAAGNNFKGLPSFGTTLVHFGYLNVF